ncbi:hypothetical protein SALBM217S_07714 [Streptomyces griseoloalbus]
MRHAQPAGGAAAGAEFGGDGLDGRGVAGEDGGAGPVDGGDGHCVAVRGEQRGDLVLGRLDGDHGAALGQGLEVAGAGGDQTAGVGERPHARDVGGGQLAQGVAQEVLRGDAPGFEQPEQGDLEGEQGRLGEAGGAQGLLVAGVQDGVLQGQAEFGVEVGADLVVGAGERGERGVQVPAHAGALGTLSGEKERGGAAQGAAGDERRVLLAVGEGAQRVARGGGVRGENGGPVLEGLPGGDEGARGVVRVVVGVVGDMLQEPCGLAAQGGLAAGGQRPGQGRRPRVVRASAVASACSDAAVGAAHTRGQTYGRFPGASETAGTSVEASDDA